MALGIRVERVSKVYPPRTRVLDGMDFSVRRGELVTVFGPNGCGKTTLLHLIAGLDAPTSGSISINDRPNTKAKVGFVFQHYADALYPWRTALGNVRLGLEQSGLPETEQNRVAQEFLARVGLFEKAGAYPYALSGGQKQLVSIARAFAYEPDVFLMDEPFSALDYSVTLRMRQQLLALWRAHRKTTIFVSHDVDEAVYLADRVLVLSSSPARIVKEIKVGLARPRRIAYLQSKRFFSLRNKVLAAFWEGMP